MKNYEVMIIEGKTIEQLEKELAIMEQRAIEGKNFDRSYMRDVIFTIKTLQNNETK